ncbi:hypothetical protein [Novosphingobium sp. ST904]|uniref:hypothetical protein n=1 Tax=Novosphingobium sp. ST904 TaxID=1684385 RepID=UPI0006C8682B|nr:hypothetical protein [Novosphingobium sp. ST904]KPH63545.1 hypothetical protein ADT71_12905 [Novosphingobium sp. ST904]TCM32407.1 hypothetical protein EDF59_124102 [Novosphingobium sp. ST904]
MFGKLISSAIAAKIDRQDGDSGLKGAVAGWAAPGLLKGAAKAGVLAAVGFGIVALVKKTRR